MTSTPVKGSGVREGFPASGMGSQAPPELEPRAEKTLESGGRGSTGEAKQKRKLKRLEPPSSFLRCIFGRDRQSWPVCNFPVCLLIVLPRNTR